LLLRRSDAVQELVTLCGDADARVARARNPNSLRAVFGKDKLDTVYCSATLDNAKRDLCTVYETFQMQRTFAFIKPTAVRKQHSNAILERLRRENFRVLRQATVQLTQAQVEQFYGEHKGRSFFDALCAFMTSGPSIALELEKPNAIREWRALCGPTNPAQARDEAPRSFRALYATDATQNAVHGSDAEQSAARELALVFDEFVPANREQTTLLLCKPDASAVVDTMDDIRQALHQGGFELLDERSFRLSRSDVESIYAEHAQESWFEDLVSFMLSGKVCAFALRRAGAVNALRALMGPADVAFARVSQPTSLRARFGSAICRNACHSPQTAERAEHELNVIFGTQTCAIVKPDAVKSANAIIELIKADGFQVSRSDTFQLTLAQAETFYEAHKDESFFTPLCKAMARGPIVALRLQRTNAVRAFAALCGPANPTEARKVAPNSLRARFGFGTSIILNAVHATARIHDMWRELALVDEFSARQSTFALIKPDCVAAGRETELIEQLEAAGFAVEQSLMARWSLQQASQVLQAVQSDDGDEHAANYFDAFRSHMSSGYSVALRLSKVNAVADLIALCGSSGSSSSKNKKTGLRAQFGSTDAKNNKQQQKDAVFCAPSVSEAKRLTSLVFDHFQFGAVTTCALIKPDVLAASGGKQAVDDILELVKSEGFEVCSKKQLRLSRDQASSFYAEHKHRSFFKTLIALMTSGPCIVLALRKPNAIVEWRRLCGPTSVSVAKLTQPESLRARFGTDNTRNGFHGSDSISSAQRELALLVPKLAPGAQNI
jgi:nucleoside diphosphate kinase